MTPADVIAELERGMCHRERRSECEHCTRRLRVIEAVRRMGERERNALTARRFAAIALREMGRSLDVAVQHAVPALRESVGRTSTQMQRLADALAPEHRWSGWPGAWCLDCGIQEPREACAASAECVCGPGYEGPCKVTVDPCPEPGSRRHDPYSQQAGGAS